MSIQLAVDLKTLKAEVAALTLRVNQLSNDCAKLAANVSPTPQPKEVKRGK